MNFGALNLVFRMGVRQAITQPWAVVGQLVILISLLVSYGGMLKALPAADMARLGFNHAQMIWYVVITEIVAMVSVWYYTEMNYNIRNGVVDVWLLRPVEFWPLFIAEWAGQELPRLLLIAGVGFALGRAISGAWGLDFQALLALVVMAISSTVIILCWCFLLGIASVWLSDCRPLFWLYQKLLFVLGGLLWPLAIYPQWLRSLAWFTPFPAILATPGNLALGQSAGLIASHAALQIVWIMIYLGLCASSQAAIGALTMSHLSYIFALLRQSMAAAGTNRTQFVFLSAAMGLQNAMFFVLWIVFFRAVPSIHGWDLHDMGLFIGMVCVGVGGAFFFAEGGRNLGRRIRTGELDTYLVRPRHPLPQLISMEANPSGLGDVIYGLILILAVGQPDKSALLLAFGVSICIGVLFVAMVVIFQSLAFFIKGGSRLADELFIAMICLGSIPQHTQGTAMKVLLFTALPAGFMAILPVHLIHQHSVALLGLMIIAVTIYAALAVGIFHLGLKRYTSSASAII